MKDNPKVSVIVNSYNYSLFLRDAIDSALSQTYPDTEVVVVDDGSTDDSPQIIASYGDRVIPVFKENGGQASAFNAGFERSNGDIICYVDSDDMLLPTAVEKAVQLFRQSDTVKVHWPLWIVDKHGKKTGQLLPREELPQGDMRDLVISNGPFYDWHLLSPTTGNAWSRSFLEQILPMPEPPYRVCADEYLFTLAPVFGTMQRVSEPQGCYRAHGSNNGWQKTLDEQKLETDMRRIEYNFHVLSQYLGKMNVEFDPEGWRQRNYNYLWIERLRKAKNDLLSLIQSGETFILVNEDEWPGELITDRSAVPFLERAGKYWGRPVDDVLAIKELERLRESGATYIVFWWTQFWWFECYMKFREYLTSKYTCIADNERVVVFSLKSR